MSIQEPNGEAHSFPLADTDSNCCGVVGLGTIGVSVALTLALAGYEVVGVDQPHALDGARRALRDEMSRARLFRIELRGVNVDRVLERIIVTADPSALAPASVVIECVTEDEAVKREVFEIINRICSKSAVFVVNTSCIPVAEAARWISRPERLIGLHFMNPVTAIRTVERIAPTTDKSTEVQVDKLLAALNMRSITVKDAPGFVINRLLMPLVNDASHLIDEGTATANDIDRLFMGCLGHKMGPLATADLIGLDTVVNSLAVLRERLDDARYQPSVCLARHVAEGRLGRKSGEGFFKYARRSSNHAL